MSDIPERPDPHDPSTIVVASISGGKDSTAMSLFLHEQGIKHRRVFSDTKWENDLTVDFVKNKLPKHLGSIDVVGNELGFEELCYKKGMFPSRLRRFCTQELKVKPILLYLDEIEGPIVNAVGIRSQESRARSKLDEWEFNRSMGVWVWRPLIDWKLEDVVNIHKAHDVQPNPLYVMGAERVGCWPCIFSRKLEIRMVAEKDPDRIDVIRRMEEKITELAKARYAARGETLESLGYHPPTFFHPRNKSGEKMTPIDEVVEWSKTSYGGKQVELFYDWSDNGCVRWGLCEAT